MNIKRILALACAGTLSLSLLTGCGTSAETDTNADGKLRVLTSFYPMYDFACKIGGDCIDVTNMSPPAPSRTTGSRPPTTSKTSRRPTFSSITARIWSRGRTICSSAAAIRSV